jgi:hypothetical protein
MSSRERYRWYCGRYRWLLHAKRLDHFSRDTSPQP